MIWNSEIFREYDIRGVYNEQFDKEFAYNLARAYTTFTRESTGKEDLKIAVGYDARISSPEIAEQIVQGLVDSGVEVYKLGLVTSPLTYFATFKFDFIDGAFMITGSHNPPEYNGFKTSVGKRTIYGDEIQQIKKIMESERYTSGKGSAQDFDIFPVYLERYKSEFEKMSGVKVILDCGNGAAGCVVRDLFAQFDIDTEILFEEPDGRFPNHHPDPTVEKNLKDLKAAVIEKGAVAGIGFDGDADRIGVVDHQGNALLGDELMMVYARDIVPRNEGCKVIGDVKCSDRFYHEIEKLGGQPIMWKTGHSLVKEKIKVEKAPFGGELSGHIFFNDRNYGYDDAMYAGLRLVEILSKTGKTIPQLMEGIPNSFNTPEIRIDTTEQKKTQIVEALKKKYENTTDASINLIDGIRISFDDGWALCRASNTQPVFVLRFESNTAEGLERIQNLVEGQIKQIEAEL